MKTFNELLKELKACSEARKWAENKTIEEVIEQCHRGDWLLWLASKVDIELQPLTLAKGHCANTVRHLMTNERSTKSVDAAIAFGEGKITKEELDAATAYSYYVAADAAYSAAAAAAAASDAVAADAAYSAAAAAAAAASYSATAAAKNENRKQTADICRKHIGELIINKVNELLDL